MNEWNETPPSSSPLHPHVITFLFFLLLSSQLPFLLSSLVFSFILPSILSLHPPLMLPLSSVFSLFLLFLLLFLYSHSPPPTTKSRCMNTCNKNVYISYLQHAGNILTSPPLSPLASVSEPDDLLWRSGYFFAAAFVAPCWLRVTLRPEEKTDAATAAVAAADSAAESRPSSGPAAGGELLRAELQWSRRKEELRNCPFWERCPLLPSAISHMSKQGFHAHHMTSENASASSSLRTNNIQ